LAKCRKNIFDLLRDAECLKWSDEGRCPTLSRDPSELGHTPGSDEVVS
jgi:hypothetical protein